MVNISQDIFISVLYTGLLFQFVVFLYSLIFIFYLIHLIKKDRQTLANKACNIKSARDSYTKNRIIVAILLFEVIYRVLGVVDYIHILRKQDKTHRVPEHRLTANCTLKEGSYLALYYDWGKGYVVLVGANYASLVLILSLICVLSLYTINTFKNNKKSMDHKIAIYLVFSVVKCCLIVVLFNWFYLGAAGLFIGVLLADYVLLLVQTRKLYHILKRRCIDIKHHGSEEELDTLKSFEASVPAYKYFSLLLMVGMGMQVLGQLVLYVILVMESVLENPCFFEVQYNMKIRLDLASKPFGIAEEVVVNFGFICRNIFNITLIITYSVYSYKYIVKMRKQVRVYRYQIVSELESSFGTPLIFNY